MTPFLTRLRALDGAASKAPWEAVRKSVRVAGTGDSTGAPNGYGGGVCNCLGAGYGLPAGDEQNVRARANAALIAALRNRAARIAALVEAADRVARYFDPTDGGQGCLDEDGKRLAAALAALAAGATGVRL